MNIIIYYFIFTILLSIIIAFVGKRSYWKVSLLVIGLILVVFGGLRALGVDNDYKSYIINYSAITVSKLYGVDYKPLTYTEPAFFFIVVFVKLLFDNVKVLFFVYAFLGVTAKLYAFKKLAPEYYIVLPLLYFSHYFLLHEMTQIRVGVACGISFLSLVPLKKNNKLSFFLINAVAILFHYTAVIFVFIYFIKDNINKYWVWVSLLLFSFLLSIVNFSIFSLIAKIPFLGFFSEKIILYQKLAETGYIDKINLFNPFILLNYLITGSVLYLGKDRINSKPYLPILLKINIISLIAFMVCKELPVMSFRIYEYLAFSQIFLVGCHLMFIKEKKTVLLFIVLLAFFYLTVNVGITKLVGEYHNILF